MNQLLSAASVLALISAVEFDIDAMKRDIATASCFMAADDPRHDTLASLITALAELRMFDSNVVKTATSVAVLLNDMQQAGETHAQPDGIIYDSVAAAAAHATIYLGAKFEWFTSGEAMAYLEEAGE